MSHPARLRIPPQSALAASVAGLVLVVSGAATPASAHASLLRIVPADGSIVASAPDRVRLVFDEKMRRPSTVIVTAPDGDRVQRGQVQVVDNIATVAIDVELPGTYEVAFRVVSADGHPVTGETTFVFQPPGAAASPSATSSSTKAAARHAHHGQNSDAGLSGGPAVAIVAAAALLGGLALLTVRRLPAGLVGPGSRDRP